MEEQPQSQPHESEKKGKIRRCPHCGQLREIKDPWKELFRWPTMQEWITLFIIVMVLFVAWAYKHDISACREFIKNGSIFVPSGNYNQIPNYTSGVIINMSVNTVTNVTNKT